MVNKYDCRCAWSVKTIRKCIIHILVHRSRVPTALLMWLCKYDPKRRGRNRIYDKSTFPGSNYVHYILMTIISLDLAFWLYSRRIPRGNRDIFYMVNLLPRFTLFYFNLNFTFLLTLLCLKKYPLSISV